MYYLMARIYAGKGDLQNQETAALAAAQRGTTYLSETLILAAEAEQKLGKLAEAEANYLKALSSKPDNPAIYRALAEMYRSQSRFTDAIDITRRALRLYPTDGGFYTDISWYYSLAGRYQEAVDSAQAGIQIQPGEYMAYTNLCRAYNDLSKPDLAISACNNALKIKPDDGETYFYLARAYDLQNKTADATRYFKKAVVGLEAFTRENPTYSDAFYLLGNAYFADDQPQKAIGAYTKSLELSPNFARARYNMAMVHVSEKQKAPATAQYNILLKLDQALAGKLKTQIDKLP
jgi:superkiller protein 3